MAFLTVVSPRFEWQQSESGPYPSQYWAISGCKFELLRNDQWVPYMEYEIYRNLSDFIPSHYPEHQSLLTTVAYYIDYYIWGIPSWWTGTATFPGQLRGQGWYWVSIPSNPTRVRVTNDGGWFQPKEQEIAWTEEDAAEGLPNFGIVIYPHWWTGVKPW